MPYEPRANIPGKWTRLRAGLTQKAHVSPNKEDSAPAAPRLSFSALNGRSAGCRDRLILAAAAAADADGADDLPVAPQGDAASEDHDPPMIGVWIP